MRKMSFILIFILSISLLQAGPNLMLDTSSIRGLGLAGCFTAVDSDVDAIMVNPAGLSTIKTKEVAFSYLSWFEDVGFLTLTGGLPLSKNLGVGAVNVTLFSVKDFPNYDENGKQLADLGASDFSMTFGMARVFNVLGKLNTGANLKIFSTKLNQISSFYKRYQ